VYITEWLDYSQGRISGAALRAAGVEGVIRYIALGGPGKLITKAEWADLYRHDIKMQFVAEMGTTDANGGYDAGVANAQKVESALWDTIPMIGEYDLDPFNYTVYCTNDQNVPVTADHVAYVRGFASVRGGASTGAYGFGPFLKAVHEEGICRWHWLAGHPPSAVGLTGIADMWQRQGAHGESSDGPGSPTTIVIGGVSCDINNFYNLAHSAPRSAKEDAMYIRCQVDPAPAAPVIAVLSGSTFVGLGPGWETNNALANIKAGLVAVQDVSLRTFNDFDKRSHSVQDSPRPVTVVNCPNCPKA
jgi:hypothetical protein